MNILFVFITNGIRIWNIFVVILKIQWFFRIILFFRNWLNIIINIKMITKITNHIIFILLSFSIVLFLGVYLSIFWDLHFVILCSFYTVLHFCKTSHFRSESSGMNLVIIYFSQLTVFRWANKVFLNFLFVWIKIFRKSMSFFLIKSNCFKTGFLGRGNFILLFSWGSYLRFKWKFLFLFFINNFWMRILGFKDHVLIWLVWQ